MGQLSLLAILVSSLLWGCGGQPQSADPPPPKVTVALPESRSLVDYNEYNGRSEASETVEVRARVRGHIIKVHFVDGELVQKGQLLFELDPQPFDAETGRAKGQLAVVEAQLQQAIKEEAREKNLFEKQAAPLQDYERSVAVRQTLEAQVATARDEVRRRELDAGYARIVAPIAGRVGRAMLTEGNLVNAGGSDPLLTTIVKADPIHVYFSVDERSLIRYRERNPRDGEPTGGSLAASKIPFEFALETEDGFPHQGTLDFADNRIDPSTGTIEVRGTAPNTEQKFVPGSRLRIRVPVSDSYSAIVVPDTAILSDQDKKYLLCLNPENVVVRRDVRLGRLLEDGMRVLLPAPTGETGISASDRVIVLGLQRARINYPVEPLNANGEPFVAAE